MICLKWQLLNSKTEINSSYDWLQLLGVHFAIPFCLPNFKVKKQAIQLSGFRERYSELFYVKIPAFKNKTGLWPRGKNCHLWELVSEWEEKGLHGALADLYHMLLLILFFITQKTVRIKRSLMWLWVEGHMQHCFFGIDFCMAQLPSAQGLQRTCLQPPVNMASHAICLGSG